MMVPTAEESSLGGCDDVSPSLVEKFQTFRAIVVLYLHGISSCTASRHGLQPSRLRCVAVPLCVPCVTAFWYNAGKVN